MSVESIIAAADARVNAEMHPSTPINMNIPKMEVKGEGDVERAYFEDGGSIYLSVMDASGNYYFANGFTGTVRFQGNVEGIKPKKLQYKDGQIVALVGIPRKEALEQAPLLSAHELYEILDTHFKKYIDYPDRDREIFIYYALFTWFHPKVNTVPYLRYLADTGKGKSRSLNVVSDISFYPVKSAGASSAASVMRICDQWHGTLVIDEADLEKSDSTNELTKFLNLGFERNQYYTKCDKEDPKKQEIFDPFCPKIIGMRQPFQDNAVEGRCLSFSPKETRRKDVPPTLNREYYESVDILRGLVARFVLANYEKVDGEHPLSLQDLQIEPRLKQMATPLSIILQVFPDGQERFLKYVQFRQQEVKEVRANSLEGNVFNALLNIANETNTTEEHGKIPAQTVADALRLRAGNTVSRLAHSIGFVTETIKVEGNTRKCLVVNSQDEWVDIVQRYYYDPDGKVPVCPILLRSRKWIE